MPGLVQKDEESGRPGQDGPWWQGPPPGGVQAQRSRGTAQALCWGKKGVHFLTQGGGVHKEEERQRPPHWTDPARQRCFLNTTGSDMETGGAGMQAQLGWGAPRSPFHDHSPDSRDTRGREIQQVSSCLDRQADGQLCVEHLPRGQAPAVWDPSEAAHRGNMHSYVTTQMNVKWPLGCML